MIEEEYAAQLHGIGMEKSGEYLHRCEFELTDCPASCVFQLLLLLQHTRQQTIRGDFEALKLSKEQFLRLQKKEGPAVVKLAAQIVEISRSNSSFSVWDCILMGCGAMKLAVAPGKCARQVGREYDASCVEQHVRDGEQVSSIGASSGNFF